MKTIDVIFKLNAADVGFLDTLAAVEGRDRCHLIKRAVADYIAAMKWQLDDIDKAIQEADRGEFMTDEEFRAEVRSWDK